MDAGRLREFLRVHQKLFYGLLLVLFIGVRAEVGLRAE